MDAAFENFRCEELGVSSLKLHAESGDKGWSLLVDGKRVVHLNSRDELAPYLESSVSDLAVRARQDCVVLQAAGVVLPEGAVLFPGERGAGKSSLAYGLSRKFPYLGDDLIFFSDKNFAIEPFPKAITLKEGSFPFVSEEVPVYRDPVRGPIKFVAPMSVPGEPLDFADLRAVIFPQFVADELPRLSPIEPEVAALALVQQMCAGLERHPRSLDCVQALAEKPCWVMEYTSLTQAEDFVRKALA